MVVMDTGVRLIPSDLTNSLDLQHESTFHMSRVYSREKKYQSRERNIPHLLQEEKKIGESVTAIHAFLSPCAPLIV